MDPAFHMQTNDFFFQTIPPGWRGDITCVASAGFYEDPSPSTWNSNNPATLAGTLPSTTSRPPFWDDTGLYRTLWFHYDYRTAIGNNASLLHTGTVASATIRGARPTYQIHP
jgi:hypothetical protein